MKDLFTSKQLLFNELKVFSFKIFFISNLDATKTISIIKIDYFKSFEAKNLK